MLMAFLLVVVVDGETVSDNRMVFKNVYRCQEFASAIEMGKWSPNDRPYYRQKNVTSYCIPKMVSNKTPLFE